MARKHRPKINIVIPQKPTANIGASLREELSSAPEVFDNIPKATSTPPTTDSSIIKKEVPEVPSSKDLNVVNTEMIVKDLKLKKESVRQKMPSSSVKITKDVEVYDYEPERLQNFTESTGTYSYDSPFSGESFGEYIEKGTQVESTPVKRVKAKTCITKPNINVEESKLPILTKMEVLDKTKFNNIVMSHKAPKFGKFEAISTENLQALRHQSFVQEVINKAVTDFFDVPRDDILLKIEIRRQGVLPILNVQLQKSSAKKLKKQKTTKNTIVLYDDNDKEELVSKPKCKKKHRHIKSCSPKKVRKSSKASLKNSNFFNSVHNYFSSLFQLKQKQSSLTKVNNDSDKTENTSLASNDLTSHCDTNYNVKSLSTSTSTSSTSTFSQKRKKKLLNANKRKTTSPKKKRSTKK